MWKTTLNWILAAKRPPDLHEVMVHIPTVEVKPSEIRRLCSRIQKQVGDLLDDRRALKALIAIEPGDRAALDRLAELARKKGDATRTAASFASGASLSPVADGHFPAPRP